MIFGLILFYLVVNSSSQQNITRKNPLLSRTKRFVAFPKGSSFIINFTATKPIMLRITNPVTNFLGECDVPFPLPTKEDVLKEKSKTKKKKLHFRQRRDLYSRLEDALNIMDLDGKSCVKRIICEAKTLLPPPGKSVTADLLTAIFDFRDAENYSNPNEKDFCADFVFEKCQISFLSILINTFKSSVLND